MLFSDDTSDPIFTQNLKTKKGSCEVHRRPSAPVRLSKSFRSVARCGPNNVEAHLWRSCAATAAAVARLQADYILCATARIMVNFFLLEE